MTILPSSYFTWNQHIRCLILLSLGLLLTGCGTTQSTDLPDLPPTDSIPSSTPTQSVQQVSTPTVGTQIVATATETGTPPPTMTPTESKTPTPVLLEPVDQTMAYQQLPQIVLSSQAPMVASPLYPTAYLETEPIPAGTQVRILARNSDASWLLVVFRNTLGWIPSIYATTGIGNLGLPTIAETSSQMCSGYLGSALAPNQPWLSGDDGEVIIEGLIYRPQPQAESTPMIAIAETGHALMPDFAHTSMETAGEILQFTSLPVDLTPEDPITLQITGLEREPTAFQAAFYTGDCTATQSALASVPTEITGMVTSATLDVWSGPGEPADVTIGQLVAGDTIALTGYASGADDRQWWRIFLPSGKAGWVDAEFVEESGCLECIPLVPRMLVLHITTEVSAVSRLVLINAVSDTSITELVDGSIVRLSELETTRLDVEAIVGDPNVESVLFYLDGQIFCANERCLENVAPYSMAGDINSGDHYANWDWSNLIGQHTISAFGCDQKNGEGNCGLPLTIQITITH